VLGICDLWVKNGSVFVYGTTIHASPTTHRIYAPSSHALPSIDACEEHTEFQLDSVNTGLGDLPYIGTRDIWTPPGVEQSALTFFVLGHTFDHNAKAPKRFKELNLDPWRPSLASGYEGSISTPRASRLILCGRRSSGLSTLFRCLANRTLETGGPGRGNPNSQKVIVLDLDTSMPEFSPPGTISLVHLQRPIFGPAFSHLLPTYGSSSRILKMHFLGDIEATDLCDLHIECILDLLNVEEKFRKEFGDSITVILAPKWLNDIDAAVASQLWAKMAPTGIVCLDNSTTSAHLRPWRSLAESAGCQIQNLPVQTFDRISLVREHNLQMQSYFHSIPIRTDCQFWDSRPILAETGTEITLTYHGRHAEVGAIVLVRGNVALEDTYDALEGSLVAIVAVKPGSIGQSDGSPRHAQAADNSSLEEADRHILPGVARTEEDLPRLMAGEEGFCVPAMNSECVGLGLVTRIDIAQRQISLKGRGTLDGIQERMQGQGQQVVLVLQKATSDGRYKTDWTRREIGNGEREVLNSKQVIGAELR
jgi:polynucleotide 5'-hydroxyl-kinase GRC3/NOL9